MINLYCLCPFGVKGFVVLALLLCSPGVITILCHGGNLFSRASFPLKTEANVDEMTKMYGSISFKRFSKSHLTTSSPLLSYYPVIDESLVVHPISDVMQENQRPVITGQTSVTVEEDRSITIVAAHLQVTDPDDSWPSDFTIQVGEGENYALSGLTITPLPNFSGLLSVPVTVNDGELTSEVFQLQIEVTGINDGPVITGQTPISTTEETPVTVSLSNILVSDPDSEYPADFTLALAGGVNYTVEGNTVIPAKDFSGTLIIPAIVNDGVDDSPAFELHITVTEVNDAPVITGQVAVSTSENQGVAIDVSQLTIVDPDNGSFTLSILAGNNYTVSGNVVTPAPGFNGSLTVQVFVSDGAANSNQFNLLINVTPVNDPPVISGQRPLMITEDTPIALSLADVTVADPDNTFPDGFTFAVRPGDHYSFSGTVVTPSTDYTGVLVVNVVVNDGVSDSDPFGLSITVTPVNDPPVVTGQNAVTTTEETARAITLGDLVVSDPDNTYPEGFSLTVFPGSNYTLSGQSVLPTPDFSGPLTVQVQVSDGQSNSNVFDVRVDVVPQNDKPVITGQVPVQTAEEVAVTIQLAHLTVLDTDNLYPQGFTLYVSPGANYTATGTTVLPAVDFNGTLNVPVAVSDGTTTSDPFNFQIQVGDANDAPTITGQNAVSTNEEQPVTLTLSHLIVSDPDNAYPTGFSLLISPGTNYTVSGQTIIPALNFAGTLSVPVRVNDGINNSPTFDFQLQVNQVNDPPSFAAIENQRIQENTPAGSVEITAISKGPLEDHQQLTFVATSGNTAVIDNPTIQFNGGSTAQLSYTVHPNASGVVTLTIVAIDNGENVPPHQNSYSASFQVEVLQVNSAPTLDPLTDVTIMEDAEQQNISLTGISAGPGEDQTIKVAVASDKPEVFEFLEVSYTSPGSTGLLQLKTKENAHGTVNLMVTVTDDGPGVAPHNNSITRRLSISIQPVEDPPVFTSQPVTVAVVGEQYEYKVTASDPDGDNVIISAIVKPSWLSLSGGNDGMAMLRGRPPHGALGDFEIALKGNDAVSSVEQRFNLYVNVRPEVASLSAATEEDTPLVFPSNFFDAGYTDQNDNQMQKVLITALPASGRLSLSATEVKAGDTISASALPQLTYTPDQNYFGRDSFGWNASDGYHLSLTSARVDVSVVPVNDPPRVILQEDTLRYEVNGEEALLAPLADIEDPDDDTLAHASVALYTSTYRPQLDILEFQATANIRGHFDLQEGVLELNGIAPIEEYRTVLRSISYVHLNTFDPILELKDVTYRLHDGTMEGEGTRKVILLQYTFIEFEIPTAFTPNGDQANDTWIIDRPGGGLEEMDNAIVSVYNKHGILVYRTKGFEKPWDGTMNGELLPADTYFYTIDLQLRNKKTYKGIVTILR